jgi:hypothetical protein
MWRYEAEHPVRVNVPLAVVYVLFGLWSRAYVLCFGMAVVSLSRIVLWRKGGFLWRQYERRVRRAEAPIRSAVTVRPHTSDDNRDDSAGRTPPT